MASFSRMGVAFLPVVLAGAIMILLPRATTAQEALSAVPYPNPANVSPVVDDVCPA